MARLGIKQQTTDIALLQNNHPEVTQHRVSVALGNGSDRSGTSHQLVNDSARKRNHDRFRCPVLWVSQC
jgi:hypothetical protein